MRNNMYILELEKERKKLEIMINNDESRSKILKQSQKFDRVMNKYMKTLYDNK